jgi:oxygen-independent coproporphyrinogen-3 oxidase
VASAAEVSEPGGFGFYVHFPWCLRKCPYCDFLSLAREPSTLPHQAYADALLAELERRGMPDAAAGPTTVFFGGGTPSLWQPQSLGKVLRQLCAVSPGAVGEVTVECNPSSLDYDTARALVDQGVNRLSIGVQGLDQERLSFLGRWHSPEDALRALRDAVRAGVPRVSADLIFGVQGQSARAAAEEAGILAAEGITHLSAYALTIEPGTQFGQLRRQGKLPMLTEDAVAECYLAVESSLETAGFAHYEISNYAREGHCAAHNLGYWRGCDYLGLGVGAWGTVSQPSGRVRYRNTVVPERYMQPGAWQSAALDHAAQDGLVREWEHIAPETALSERIMLGLRLSEGIDVDSQASQLGVEAWPEARLRARNKRHARGDLQQVGSRLRIAPHAWLRADGIIAELM